ncbi:MAG TPA: Rrf2 family transcriptional regulator [Spirochaetota bacterium]|nr:Rrf2 family transcriptional regulator [Spirochaetota bacterium]HOM37974.1 Rrf2 family transcriptional regulator [Spirochaetota bacterium]HPQ48779.1 Rrf2 family transcriptional regulator [Spirochaetota bacterium]
MKLSTRSRYGIRILLEIARNYGEKVTSVKEISLSQNLPRKYVEQIIIKLKKNGIINGERGIKGGYVLKDPPSEIRLDKIISILENDIKLVDCKGCSAFSKCNTRKVWEGAEKRLRDYFSGIRLSDIL